MAEDPILTVKYIIQASLKHKEAFFSQSSSYFKDLEHSLDFNDILNMVSNELLQ